jgi:hypothetical protein
VHSGFLAKSENILKFCSSVKVGFLMFLVYNRREYFLQKITDVEKRMGKGE